MRMRVLGLDPGSRRTGWGVVERYGERLICVAHDVVTLGDGGLATRLAVLHDELQRVVRTYEPAACAVEGLFKHRNAKSALVLAHARGICLLAAAAAGVPVVEYSPARVKRSITGNGAATKERVGDMVARALAVEGQVATDAADALAVALCHLQSERTLRVCV
jgi:crossover junction endodeoxyribonuclease RuvC